MAERLPSKNARLSKWDAFLIIAVPGGILASLSMGIIGVNQIISEPEIAPSEEEAAISSGTEELQRRLGDVAEIAGPVVVRWASCPPGGEQLASDMRVNAYSNADDPGPNEPNAASAGFIEIDNVMRYEGENGEVVAWCGTSIGDQPEHNINGPIRGTVVVIPNPPGCTPPQTGEWLMCPGQPIEYDLPAPDERKGTLDLGEILLPPPDDFI